MSRGVNISVGLFMDTYNPNHAILTEGHLHLQIKFSAEYLDIKVSRGDGQQLPAQGY